MAVYKIDSKKVQGQDGLVYLYLYKLETGQKQPQLDSLKIKIPVKYWNAQKMKISKELPDKYLKQGCDTVEKLNKWLSEQLEEFIKVNGDFSFIPSDEKTINDWIDTIIKRTVNVGTRMRYKNIKNLVEQFQEYYTKEKLKKLPSKIVYFKSLDVNWIEAFKVWLITVNGNEKNSSNFKVKALAGMIRKAHNERWYRYMFFPFNGVKHQFEETSVEILNFEELKRFISTPLIEVSRRRGTKTPKEILWKTPVAENIKLRNSRYKKREEGHHTLDDIRNYWLFQLFTQGIRVSDLITLRWNDFTQSDEGLRIKKKMFKTKKYVDILVTDRQTEIIEKYIFRYKELFTDESVILEKLIKDDSFANVESYYIEEEPERDKNETVLKLSESYLSDCYHSDLNGNGYYFGYSDIENLKSKVDGWDSDGTEGDDFETLTKWVDEQVKNSRLEIKRRRFNLICSMIRRLSAHRQFKTEFVFNLMRNKYFDGSYTGRGKDFTKVGENNDFGYISEDQYRVFQSARTLYNNLLKIVAFQCDIKKNLTSHIARHSYTSLMIDLGVNIDLFDIMTSLGHKHITTTQGYVQRFSNKKIDKLNTVISNALGN